MLTVEVRGVWRGWRLTECWWGLTFLVVTYWDRASVDIGVKLSRIPSLSHILISCAQWSDPECPAVPHTWTVHSLNTTVQFSLNTITTYVDRGPAGNSSRTFNLQYLPSYILLMIIYYWVVNIMDYYCFVWLISSHYNLTTRVFLSADR